MFEYVDSLPNGIVKSLLNLVSMFWDTCISVYEFTTQTLSQLLNNLLTSVGISEKWADLITNFLEKPSNAWLFSATLGELILGSLLVSLLIFGIVKFFTDIVL